MGEIKHDCIIVGGGISGLAQAYYEKKQGKKVLLIEASDHFGGWLKTIQKDEYLLELGPNSTYESEEILSLAKELGFEDEILYPDESCKTRYVALDPLEKDVALHNLPLNPLALLTSPLFGPRAFGRILFEPFVSRSSKEDESVKNFITRRFGSKIANVASAAITGIYAADIEQLSLRSAFPNVWEKEEKFGSVIRGMIKSKTKKKKIISFKNGMQSLADTLRSSLGDECLKANTAIENLSDLSAEKVILATPASATAKLIEPLDPTLAATIREIPYAPIGIIHVAYDEGLFDHPLDGFGFLAKPRPGQTLLGCIFSSNQFSQRAPQGKTLLTCMCGGAVNPELSDVTKAEVREQALRELENTLGARSIGKVLNTSYFPNAIPNYAINHHQIVEQVSSFQKNNPQITMTGNWLSGVSVADRLRP